MLSGEEFAPLIESGKSYFMKDGSSYYRLIWGDGLNSKYEKYKWNKVAVKLNDIDSTINEAMSCVFPGTFVLTVDHDEMTAKIVEEFNKLVDGKSTVRETADAIYEYAMYRYFE